MWRQSSCRYAELPHRKGLIYWLAGSDDTRLSMLPRVDTRHALDDTRFSYICFLACSQSISSSRFSETPLLRRIILL
jgi:hypothetical protein